jgi:hypothetical protein
MRQATVAEGAALHLDSIKAEQRRLWLLEEVGIDGINWRVKAYVKVVEYAQVAQGLKTLTFKTVGWGAGKYAAWRAAKLAAQELDNPALVKAEVELLEVAASTEYRFFNRYFGTCNRCAVRNAAQVVELEAVKDAGITTIVYENGPSHAVAWVKLRSGEIRYLSYGKIYSRLEDIVPDAAIKYYNTYGLDFHMKFFEPSSNWWFWPE